MATRTRDPQQGISQEEAESQLDQMNAQSAQTRTQDLGADAPPAIEPLQPDRVALLQSAVQEAVAKLGGDQVAELPMEEVAEAVDQVPPDTFAPVMMLIAFARDRGLSDFDVDLDELATSNDGLAELAATISEMANSPEVQKAVRAPGQTEAAEPEVESEPDKPNRSDRLKALI